MAKTCTRSAWTNSASPLLKRSMSSSNRPGRTRFRYSRRTWAAAMQSQPASETGNPLVDMQTISPAPKLSDPGLGLRGNGRKVLAYADIKSLFDDPDGRDPSRTVELHLTGHMEKFAWSFRS